MLQQARADDPVAASDGGHGRTDYAIAAEGLVKRYGDTIALDGVDLAVRTGTVLGLLGPNGAGKTTAVRILATLLEPDAGRATVGGYDVVSQAHQVRQLLGLTGQFASIDETLTGMENLVLIGRLLGMPRARARDRAAQLLTTFQLDEAANRSAKTYSGGMRRRLDLAASLVGAPRVLCLDEPTTGLDPRSRLTLWDSVRDLVKGGVTVLLTTQYLDEADALADDIVVIDRGKVIAQGTPDELKSATGVQRLSVRPSDDADVPRVVKVLHEYTREEPEVRGTQVITKVDDESALPAVVRALDEAGVAVRELLLRGSTLDEVFLSITGHPAEESRDEGDTDPETPAAETERMPA